MTKISAIFLILLLTLQSSFAENAQPTKGGREIKPSIGFYPDFLRKEVKAGDVITEKLVVQNLSDVNMEAEFLIDDLYTDELGRVDLKSGQIYGTPAIETPKLSKKKKGKEVVEVKKSTMLPSIRQFISIPEAVLQLKAKEKKIISYTVKIPENATGSYFFRYTIRPLKKYSSAVAKNLNGGLGFVLDVNYIGVLSIKDKLKYKAQIELKTNYDEKTKKLIIQSELLNTGNGYLRNIEGNAVLLKNSQIIVNIPLNLLDNLPGFYPNTKKYFVGSFDGKLDSGDYKLIVTYQDEKRNLVESLSKDLKIK